MPYRPEGRPTPPPRKEGDEPPTLSRRGLLAALGLGGLTAAGVVRVATSRVEGSADAEPSDEEVVPREPAEERTPAPEAPEREMAPEGPYRTGPLAGRRLADLFAKYLGIPEGSVVPEHLPANFHRILSDLWTDKREVVMRREPGWIENTRRAEQVFLESYRAEREGGEAGPHTLEDLADSFDRITRDLHRSVDFSRLDELTPAFRGLTGEDKDLVKTLAGNINGQMLLAYGITELMPSIRNSALNVDMTDFLVTNAGAQFLGKIPAINDPYLSVGLFQLTSHAVYSGPEGKRGASLINQLVRDEDLRIPDSVIRMVKLETQARAAYLFAIENLARLVVSIRSNGNAMTRSRRMRTLASQADGLKAGTLQYIASAHHNPAQARRGFIAWLDVGLEGKHSIHCGSRIRGYVIKTKGIYDELQNRLGS